jgi:citrate lyase beta subunit
MRQPVHVVYGGAHLFKPGISERLGRIALASAERFAAKDVFDIAPAVFDRVIEKLHREPVEDYRIDFEDGYGFRSDAEEDGHAVAAAKAVREGLHTNSLPPFIGIRIKPLNAELRTRSLRTLELFLRELISQGGALPPNFVVTLPKLTTPDEPAELDDKLNALEGELGIAPRTIRMEIMIETPQAFMAPDGASNLPRFLAAGNGRISGAHFGPYDYTSSIGIASNVQDLMHPACDMARHMMQLAYSTSGIHLSDGPTNVMPVGDDPEKVHAAWRLHYKQVSHSLRMGFYQGWDLHPAQLVSRYAAVYNFYQQGIDAASARLRNFIDRAAQASLVGQQFDDAATGQALLNFFQRAIGCGALSEAEARERTGLSHEDIAAASFSRIVQRR